MPQQSREELMQVCPKCDDEIDYDRENLGSLTLIYEAMAEGPRAGLLSLTPRPTPGGPRDKRLSGVVQAYLSQMAPVAFGGHKFTGSTVPGPFTNAYLAVPAT
ncbi:hypothetical protein CONLIGDRAFT_677927 [Coniochaeta ligniaria NRRL 30616]|uniref:Uncharacterized protein n=1 Tax=Coniochaeta ligniaria NRRL 30616 TaxID=1408157 RepID=A0A1J7J2B2_9PEZI|nr:hypothetical protein CONLIGDRAFT_677927 [Coniochaeta ligniaria NRRL 30616]